MWFDVMPRIDTKNVMCLKEIKGHAQNRIPIPGEREMMPTSSVSVNEGHFTLIISKFNNQQIWKGRPM
jgi:hypothetical protein